MGAMGGAAAVGAMGGAMGGGATFDAADTPLWGDDASAGEEASEEASEEAGEKPKADDVLTEGEVPF